LFSIRPEQPEDYLSIYNVNRTAFGRDVEARLVEKLRATSAYVPELSLLAVTDGGIVGHILFCRIRIEAENRSIPSLALGTLAVLPDFQKQGAGSLLVREGLEKSRQLGFRAVVVIGHSGYYPRFGFTPAREKGLELPFDAPSEAFMVREIVPNGLRGVSGTVIYPPEFSEG
jgi:putative acetyltransferase